MSSRKSMSASELTRIRRAQALTSGVPRPAGSGFSEDILEKNFVSGPIVVNGLTVSDCCPTPDPAYTVLFYVSDPETGDVPRSLGARSLESSRSISTVSVYYMDKKYLDENGQRKSREQIRADLAALRPPKPVTEDTPKVKAPKFIDVSGRRVRTERQVKERKVNTTVNAERSMRPRSGIPTATISFSTGETAMIIREYVNGVVSVETTFPPNTSDSYTPTQACVLSIVCPGIESLNISGSNITQIKFNEAELQALENLVMEELSLTTPIIIPSLNSLRDLEIRDSTLATVTFCESSQFYMDTINIHDNTIDTLTLQNIFHIDITFVIDDNTIQTLLIKDISYINGGLEIDDNTINTVSIDRVLYLNEEINIRENTITSSLTIKNIRVSDDNINIDDNTIETLLLDGISYVEDYINIDNNTIGTLTITNIGEIGDDIDIDNNTVQRIYVSNVGDCDSVDITDNTGLTVLDIRNCGNTGISIRTNSGLTTFTIQNVVTVGNLEIEGADLTSYTLANIYNMYSLSLDNLGSLMTSVTIGDPSINQTLEYLYIYDNPNLTSLTLLPMPNLRQIDIYNNPVLPAVVLPSLPLLEYIYINYNNQLASIHATQVSSTINNATFSSNYSLTTLDISGGTYDYFYVYGNSALTTLDMSKINIYNELSVNNNALTTVYTGTQTINGNYNITYESALTSLNLTNVTLVNSGQQINIANNISLATVIMPATLVNGLQFYMNNCNISQAAANAIEEYFYDANSQALNNCYWSVLNQLFGPLSTATPSGWTTLVTTRGWTIE
jgi:hypothetical protein